MPIPIRYKSNGVFLKGKQTVAYLPVGIELHLSFTIRNYV